MIYCYQTRVGLQTIPVNTTQLYLREITSNTTQVQPRIHDGQQSQKLYPYLSTLDLTSSRIVPHTIYDFLKQVPNLRVLLMHNVSIRDLSRKFFTELQNVQVLELQENHFEVLTSLCFMGLSNVLLLDLHHMPIKKVEPKAFEGMSSLKLLNLSYNKLTHFTEDVFESLKELSIVDLRGNTLNDIHWLTFQRLHATVYASSQHMCCFVPPTSTCFVTKLRYYNI